MNRHSGTVIALRTWLPVFLLCAALPAAAQNPRPIISTPEKPAPDSPQNQVSLELDPAPVEEKRSFQWAPALRQSFYMISIQHGYRVAADGVTRHELDGKFFKDWGDSVKGIRGWDDGDGFLWNYVGHPIQGAISGHIGLQNDPAGRELEFSNSRPYWMSRLRAMGWSALYSTQWEIGPLSEASIGNFGKPGVTNGAGYVDLVVTPTAGFAMIVVEDWLDRTLVRRIEAGSESHLKRRIFRTLLNPQRAAANLLRGKVPWHRDSRPLY